jgi:hypothetical protein
MMSTMSDGWKFEQIVNVGSHYNYTTDDHSEYLLIVSKEYGINENVNEKEGSDKRKVWLKFYLVYEKFFRKIQLFIFSFRK